MNRLFGDNIMLREFCEEDISGIRKWVLDPETTQWLGSAYLRPQTYRMTESYLNSFLNGDAAGYNYVIADLWDNTYLGQINLFRIDPQARSAELSIVLCPDKQKQGIGSSALKLVMDAAFTTLNLHRVFLSVYANNTTAVKCYEKCGFRVEGVLRDSCYRNGQYSDTLIMGMLSSDRNNSL